MEMTSGSGKRFKSWSVQRTRPSFEARAEPGEAAEKAAARVRLSFAIFRSNPVFIGSQCNYLRPAFPHFGGPDPIRKPYRRGPPRTVKERFSAADSTRPGNSKGNSPPWPG